jgi:2-polyprenyl-6-hydroxyphenyl methylase/3-demethylubiquinone-9 3-methyltransferase
VPISPGDADRTERTASGWDHTSHDQFYKYYKEASISARALGRFRAIRDTIVRLHPGLLKNTCAVADIGCGAGTQSLLWAELGCNVHGLDVNEPLVELGRLRTAEAGYNIDFRVGSAVALPWPDASMQVCLAVELLEHVADWQRCLLEFSRVVAAGGVLYVSTSNALCPFQQEFTLPLYSWYPAALKKYCERLAVSTRPQLANYAKYPAINWFTFYQLRDFLRGQGFDCYDRFDLVDPSRKGIVSKTLLWSIREFRLLRFLAYVATEGTAILAVKTHSSPAHP